VAKALTAVAIRTMKAPLEKRVEVKDGLSTGLYLVLQPSGHRGFAMRFRGTDGRPQKLVLGVFDPGPENDGEPVIGQPLTLSAARRLSTQILRDRAMGRDVISDHRNEKHRRRIAVDEAVTNNFAAAARQFITEHAMAKTRRGKQTSRIFGLDGDQIIKGGLVARWGDKPLAQITGHDVFAIVDETRRHGTPGLEVRNPGISDPRGRQMARALSKFFAWCVQHRKIQSSPCAGMHVPPAPTSRDRILSDAELIRIWQACDDGPFDAVMKLLVLTGCRLREISNMSWDEIDGDLLTIPASRSKNRKAHQVPLTSMAKEIIAAQMRTGPFVFSTNGRSTISGWSKWKRKIDALTGVSNWRIHDARRKFVTGCAELGIRPDVIEMAVNHQSGHRSGIAGTYNRATLLPERRAALERWSLHVENLVGGSNVVSLRRA
jgi:integrase